jgi:hypothetical protein
MIAYIFITPKKDKFVDRLKASIRYRTGCSLEAWFGISLLQITAIYWVLIGILLNIVGKVWVNSNIGGIIIFIIIGVPLFVGAILVERRKKDR